ncbi:MAG: hypothetical protein DRO36_04875 [Candidatus Hecatellales archaeon]|nr:MAG: hypothetical protein DRO36_04875 [Candidatus Hecatellales archaeon]
MKALILAGGYGTRLRPLSCTKPKLLFPVANKPLLEWVLERLSRVGVSTVVLAVNYKAEMIQSFCGSEKYGLKILYSRETTPLGTGGPIKLAEKVLSLEEGEKLLILNGDIFSDVNFEELKRIHEEHVSRWGAVLTLTLFEVEDPSRYGVVEMDQDGRILKFVEKPKQGEEVSKNINAGVYLTDQRIFGYLKEGKHSIEREVFPGLAASGLLFGYKHKGLWMDIGKIEDYMAANFKVLEEMAKDKPQLGENVELASNVKIVPPVMIGSDVRVGEGSRIGPYTVIGDKVSIGGGCRIRDSVLFNGVTVGSGCRVTGVVMGDNVFLGENVRVGRGSVVGEGVTIAGGVRVAGKVFICPYKEVNLNVLRPKHIM